MGMDLFFSACILMALAAWLRVATAAESWADSRTPRYATADIVAIMAITAIVISSSTRVKPLVCFIVHRLHLCYIRLRSLVKTLALGSLAKA